MASTIERSAHADTLDQERAKMRRVLSRFDIIFFTVAAFISLDTIAVTAAYGGGETFFWLGFTLIVWLVPYGMIIAELGSTFPVEGGPYVWPRMAFGRLAGALTSVFYWMSNPVWMGGTLAALVVATINTFYLKNPMGTLPSIIVGILVCGPSSGSRSSSSSGASGPASSAPSCAFSCSPSSSRS